MGPPTGGRVGNVKMGAVQAISRKSKIPALPYSLARAHVIRSREELQRVDPGWSNSRVPKLKPTPPAL